MANFTIETPEPELPLNLLLCLFPLRSLPFSTHKPLSRVTDSMPPFRHLSCFSLNCVQASLFSLANNTLNNFFFEEGTLLLMSTEAQSWPLLPECGGTGKQHPWLIFTGSLFGCCCLLCKTVLMIISTLLVEQLGQRPVLLSVQLERLLFPCHSPQPGHPHFLPLCFLYTSV